MSWLDMAIENWYERWDAFESRAGIDGFKGSSAPYYDYCQLWFPFPSDSL